MIHSDPRFIRTSLQDRQAAQGHPPAPADHDLATGPARATRPDLVGHLLCRAAALLRPTGPTPVISLETEGDQECP